MKKVNINKSINVNELINIFKNEKYDIEYIDVKDNVDEYGYGIYEFCFGERNILEDIIKNDNIMEINDIINDFDIEDYLAGRQTPVYFGSAINNFGVKELLDAFVEIAPQPQSRKTLTRMIEPTPRTNQTRDNV